MADTVGAILGLHEFTVLGAAILVPWCLSPLGGQSAQRILVVGSISETTNLSLQYFAFDQTIFANTWYEFHTKSGWE